MLVGEALDGGTTVAGIAGLNPESPSGPSLLKERVIGGRTRVFWRRVPDVCLDWLCSFWSELLWLCDL